MAPTRRCSSACGRRHGAAAAHRQFGVFRLNGTATYRYYYAKAQMVENVTDVNTYTLVKEFAWPASHAYATYEQWIWWPTTSCFTSCRAIARPKWLPC